MLVYRIALARYAGKLKASGRAARWNPNDVEMIYMASSRSLACLENVVHRSPIGLTELFNVMTIECPGHIRKEIIELDTLPANWTDFDQMSKTQRIGEKWIRENRSAILQVPSSIVHEEVNYLLNPNHPDFKLIKLIKTLLFVFDDRIKR